ncbi:hypothetical protein RchiOBHm_Chr7g0229811 [Rosa chinensis]|uniref:Uncharacterized protein n=1 Tax=Rosa chinensis TaxID=74649 RepID=A0A2P6PF84_ROSCH|nr:hypothetical protein RchiOBHm_Chr7g0229811 [Rosa chinensis]
MILRVWVPLRECFEGGIIVASCHVCTSGVKSRVAVLGPEIHSYSPPELVK